MEKLLRETQPACVVCGSDDRLAVDHVVPMSKDGKLLPGNAVILCKSHNSSKSNKDLDELDSDFASRIREAAEQFLDVWNSQRVTG
jgi:5-methylcytosine-specific restriction endonuclease McrA